jgi:Septum formation
MAREWKCARCSSTNGEAAIACSSCGLIRGGVVPAGSHTASASVPAAAEGIPVEAPPSVDSGIAAEVPPTVDQVVAPPAATPLWRRIPTGWVVVAVIVVAASIAGWYFNASRSSSGEISKGGDLTASDLRVGDCFDLKDPAANQVDNVTARPCTDAHEYEIFFVDSLQEGDYPSEDAFATFVNDSCGPAFDTYIGKAYTDSELDIFWFYPTSDAWGGGDRSIQCAAYHPRIHRLTESLKGSNQ